MRLAKPLAPGSMIGILGGGQLGRMLALAAGQLGLKCHIFAPEEDSPAFHVSAAHTVADYHDFATESLRNALTSSPTNLKMCRGYGGISEKHCVLAPSSAALKTAQDRIDEKPSSLVWEFRLRPLRR
jgi:5-(carboxyamino)imidazole ribonucleotide synthase